MRTPASTIPVVLAARRGRALVVNGVKWKWRCGSKGGILAYSETGQRAYAHAWQIKNLSFVAFERGQRKRTNDGMVTPSEVSAWLADLPQA